MFTKLLSSLPFCNDDTNDLFRQIRSNCMYRDVSFLATMRALIYPRKKNREEIVSAEFTNKIVNSGVSEFQDSELFNHITYNVCLEANSALFFGIDVTGNVDVDEVLNKFVRGCLARFPDFHEMKDLKVFCAAKMNARFLICEERRMMIAAIGNINIKKYHYLQAFIPRFFPQYFKDDPPKPEEVELLSSLMERFSDNYERLIAQAAERMDLRGLAIKELVGSFHKTAWQAEITMTERDINRNLSLLKDLDSQRNECLSRIEDLNVRVIGLKCKLDQTEDDDDLVSFFQTHKNVIPIEATCGSLAVVVNTYLDSFDPEVYEMVSQRESSYLYECCEESETFSNWEDRKAILDMVFGENPTFRIRTCGVYFLNIDGSVDTMEHYKYPKACENSIPNPHLDHYKCLGDYTRYISDFLQKGDFVGALEQCVCSAKSVNLGESITMEKFMNDMFRRYIDVPYLENIEGGHLMTPREVLREKRYGSYDEQMDCLEKFLNDEGGATENGETDTADT